MYNLQLDGSIYLSIWYWFRINRFFRLISISVYLSKNTRPDKSEPNITDGTLQLRLKLTPKCVLERSLPRSVLLLLLLLLFFFLFYFFFQNFVPYFSHFSFLRPRSICCRSTEPRQEIFPHKAQYSKSAQRLVLCRRCARFIKYYVTIAWGNTTVISQFSLARPSISERNLLMEPFYL